MQSTWSPRPGIGGTPASGPCPSPGAAAERGENTRAAAAAVGRPLPRLAAAAAAVLFAAGSALPAPAAAQQCLRDAERTAFDLRAVQSQMMVVALVCARQDDYNAFVHRHQRGLLGAYQEMTSHFRRLHGPAAGEAERDRYVTELANTQSQDQLRQGDAFCRNMEPLVRWTLAARDTGEVARIPASADLTVPHYPLGNCGALSAVSAPAAAGVGRLAERGSFEGDARDDEIVELRARLERLERQPGRQPEPLSKRPSPASRAFPSRVER